MSAISKGSRNPEQFHGIPISNKKPIQLSRAEISLANSIDDKNEIVSKIRNIIITDKDAQKRSQKMGHKSRTVMQADSGTRNQHSQ